MRIVENDIYTLLVKIEDSTTNASKGLGRDEMVVMRNINSEKINISKNYLLNLYFYVNTIHI